MFLPINQYYANAPPQRPIEMRKKHRKYKNVQSSGERETANQEEESQVHSASIATTASSDEFISTSSVSSSMNRTSENSNHI